MHYTRTGLGLNTTTLASVIVFFFSFRFFGTCRTRNGQLHSELSMCLVWLELMSYLSELTVRISQQISKVAFFEVLDSPRGRNCKWTFLEIKKKKNKHVNLKTIIEGVKPSRKCQMARDDSQWLLLHNNSGGTTHEICSHGSICWTLFFLISFAYYLVNNFTFF